MAASIAFSRPTCRAWLPKESLRRESLNRALAETVDQWSARWFAGRPLALLDDIEGRQRKVPAEAQAWHVLPDGAALGLSAKARLALASMMLDTPVNEKTLAAADRPVVEGLAKACVDDLADRIAGIFKLPPDSEWAQAAAPDPAMFTDALAFTIAPPGGPSLANLLIGPDLHVAYLKSRIPAAPRPIRLERIGAAMALQQVTVSARLGGCDLTLSEASALAKGDVLILDSELTAGLSLSLDDETLSGLCRPELDDERLRLKIVEPYFE